jgi:hypothetical protein
MQKRWSRRMRKVNAARGVDCVRIRVDTSARCSIWWPIEVHVSNLRCQNTHHDEMRGSSSPSFPPADLQRCVAPRTSLLTCHHNWAGHTPLRVSLSGSWDRTMMFGVLSVAPPSRGHAVGTPTFRGGPDCLRTHENKSHDIRHRTCHI